jgi:tetratricopeptide (TPR) repeat protein
MQRAVALQPENSLYVGALGGYLLAGGQVEQMQAQLAQLEAAPATDIVAHWMAGILLMASDQEASQAAYRRALAAPELTPGAAAAIHMGLGQLAVLRGDMAAAGEEFAAALEQAPDYTDAEIALGDIALLAGEPSAAAAHYRDAMETLDGYGAKYSYDTAGLLRPALHARQALAARWAGDEARAAAALAAAHSARDTLYKAAPQWPGVAVIDGLLALLDGREPAADEAFARAVACDATYATAREQIELLVKAGQDALPAD